MNGGEHEARDLGHRETVSDKIIGKRITNFSLRNRVASLTLEDGSVFTVAYAGTRLSLGYKDRETVMEE